MAEKLLQLDHVTMRFGGVVALDDVNFHIDKGKSSGSSARMVPARPPAST